MSRILAACLLLVCFGCDKPKGGERRVPTARTVDPRVAAVNPKCRAMCKISGRCTWDEKVKRCLASKVEDCRASDTCRSSGLCTLDKEKCVGGSAEDCKASEQCKSAGACSFTGDPFKPCRPRTDADCAQSAGCKRKGHCHPAQDRCVVQNDEDCLPSEVCRRDGACSVATFHKHGDEDEPHQAQSAAVSRGVPRCEAGSDADCAQSQACKQGGRCKAVDGYCR